MFILAASKALSLNSSIGDFLPSQYAQALGKHKEMLSGKEIFSDHSIMTRDPDRSGEMSRVRQEDQAFGVNRPFNCGVSSSLFLVRAGVMVPVEVADSC